MLIFSLQLQRKQHKLLLSLTAVQINRQNKQTRQASLWWAEPLHRTGGGGFGGLGAERWIFGRRSDRSRRENKNLMSRESPTNPLLELLKGKTETAAAARKNTVPVAVAMFAVCRRGNITEWLSLFLASLVS